MSLEDEIRAQARRLQDQLEEQIYGGQYGQQQQSRRAPTRAELLGFMQTADALAAIARTAMTARVGYAGPIYVIGGVNGDIRLCGARSRGKQGDQFLGELEVHRGPTAVFRFVPAA